MAGFVDIHAHLLPGIDDGPPDLEQALEMARAAADAGIETIAATPHLRSDFPNVRLEELAVRCGSLREAIDRAKIPIRVVSGAEASLTWALEASEEELVLASYGQGGNDLLIETPSSMVIGLDRIIYELHAKGYRITLAHPERNRQLQRNSEPLRALVDQGVLLQVNAESLLGRDTPGVRRFARHLCREGLVHAIASDGHRAHRWRPVTHLHDALDATVDLVGPERSRWLMRAAPEAIVEGAPLPRAPAIAGKRRRRRFLGRR